MIPPLCIRDFNLTWTLCTGTIKFPPPLPDSYVQPWCGLLLILISSCSKIESQELNAAVSYQYILLTPTFSAAEQENIFFCLQYLSYYKPSRHHVYTNIIRKKVFEGKNSLEFFPQQTIQKPYKCKPDFCHNLQKSVINVEITPDQRGVRLPHLEYIQCSIQQDLKYELLTQRLRHFLCLTLLHLQTPVFRHISANISVVFWS